MTPTAEEVKRYARDGDCFYECDAGGNWVYTATDVPGRAAPLMGRRIAFMDSRVRPVVYASDHDRIVSSLRAEVERLGKDARRYAVVREFMAPRYLSDRLNLEWRDIPKSQTLAEKIDELCDSAMEKPE